MVRTRIVVGFAVLLLVAVAAATSIWWGNRSDELPIGSWHRVVVTVRAVKTGDCTNNIGGARVGHHQWTTTAHAPDSWGVGEVSGWLEVTAKPSPGPLPSPDPTARFTADSGGSVDFWGGGTGKQLSLLPCT